MEGKRTENSIRLVMGTIWPEEHVFHGLQESFANTVESDSNGSLVVEVRSGRSEADLLAKAVLGEIQMVSTSAIQSSLPAASLLYLPFLYSGIDHYRSVWRLGGETVGQRIAERIEAIGTLKVLGYTVIGQRDMLLAETAIERLEDFSGLRVRVDGADISVATFEALGAEPHTIGYYDVSNALANGAIDAAENSPINFEPMGWHSHCRHLSLTKHRMLLNIEMMHLDTWVTLGSKNQEIIREAVAGMSERFAQTAKEGREEAIRNLQRFDISINEVSQEEMCRMKDAVAKLNQSFITKNALDEEMRDIVRLTSS